MVGGIGGNRRLSNYATDCNKVIDGDKDKDYDPDKDPNNIYTYNDVGLDSKLDNYVLKSNIVDILELVIRKLFVNPNQSIEGIEDFTNLKNLYLTGNEIEKVSLSKNYLEL